MDGSVLIDFDLRKSKWEEPVDCEENLNIYININGMQTKKIIFYHFILNEAGNIFPPYFLNILKTKVLFNLLKKNLHVS